MWLRQLKKRYRKNTGLENHEEFTSEEDIEQIQIQAEKQQLFQEVFAELDQDCQKVLQAFFDGMSMKEIAEKFDYSANYVKLKKFKCKEQFLAKIKNRRTYLELIS